MKRVKVIDMPSLAEHGGRFVVWADDGARVHLSGHTELKEALYWAEKQKKDFLAGNPTVLFDWELP